jgi:beta-N-acetylhexosaminidase
VPASFSERWIRGELRGRLGFQGAVFCDDLSMEGARVVGDPPTRAAVALAAGCDMLPVCNDRAAAVAVLDASTAAPDPVSGARLARLVGRPTFGRAELLAASDWKHAVAQIGALDPTLSLPLDA